jgi:hypothetical protein
MASTPKQTTQVVEPWSGAKGPLLDVYKQYGEALAAGQPAYYPGSTIADQSQATIDANNGAEAIARDGTGQQSLTNANQAVSTIAAGGTAPGTATLNAAQNFSNPGLFATLGAMSNINTNFSNPAMGNAQTLSTSTNPALAGAQALAGQSSANPQGTNLADMAAGRNIGNNPYLEASISGQTQKIADQLRNTTLPGLQSSAVLAGRNGSGAFARQVNSATDTAANQMSKVATDMYANQYNQDVASQLAANQQVGSAYNSNFSNNLNANQNLANVGNTQNAAQLAGTQLYGDLANSQNTANQNANAQLLAGAGQLGAQAVAQQGVRTDAANSLNQQYNQGQQNQLAAAGLAGQTYQNQYLPYEMLANIGAQRDTRAQDELNAQIQEWDFKQQMPLQQLANYSNILNGGNYNTTTSTTTGGSSTLGNIFGGLTSLAGLGMKLSDRRMKENIKYVGMSPTGHKIYEYNYIGEDQRYVGPMAQDIAETDPDMVIEHNDNLFINSAFIDRMAG